MTNLKFKLFKKKYPLVIGMVHCAPLLGYEGFPGLEKVEKKFLADFRALVSGGVDAIMIENNYDIPHYEKAKTSTLPQLTKLCLEARGLTKKPLGLCVLWNDYEAALSIAKLANFQFIRTPVFVDKVQTDYGIFSAKAKEAIAFRKKIKAEDIMIFADVQVKHAKHLIKRPLTKAVQAAIKEKADAIIITGKWTGDAPTEKDVQDARKSAGKIPVLLGSGITPENMEKYQVNAFIVGSYFKGQPNPKKKDYHNIFPWEYPLQTARVKKFMDKVKSVKWQ
ncbi:MAG: BtpA/SgcQ family protein [Candidatus Parcubacteria bacterium]|nr:BtpA/SgcQ family protein [Candidatus Parcubacteria bacterium]